MNVFDLSAKLTLDSSEYEKGLKGASGEAKQFGQELNGGISKILKIGAVAAGAAVAGVTAFSRTAVNTGMQFDTAMSQVAATMGATTDEIQELRDYAQQMGATTAFSATQAAQALNYMALAGYDAETSMSMLPNVLNLAAAGSMDLARASDMLTDSQSALGLTLDETNELVDKMAQAASKSNTSVEQLGDAILTVGGTAKNLTGGTTELATALGILADNGVKGAEGGTALRNIILSLSAPTDTAAKKLDELSVSVYDAEGNMRGLNEIMGELDAAMATMTQEQRMNAMATIFNNRDLKSAEALLANYGARWDELSGYIDNAAGAAEKMADTQLDNLTGDITLMNSALEGARIAFSDGITPALRNLVQMVTKALSNPKTTKFLKEAGSKIGEVATRLAQLAGGLLTRVINLFKNGGTQIKAFAASFGALVVAIKAYQAASLLAAKGASLLTKAISFISSPLGAAVAGFAALTAILGVVAIRSSKTAAQVKILTDAQQDNVNAALEAADAYQQMREERGRQMQAVEQESEKTRELWEELKALVDENGNVIDGQKERVDYILGELNGALGTEYTRNGEIIDQYQQMQDEIDNLIRKRKAERLLESAESSYTDAITKLSSTETAIYDQQRQVDAINASIAAAESRAATAWENIQEAGKWGADTSGFESEYTTAIEEAAALREQLTEEQAALDSLLADERAAQEQITHYEAAEAAMLAGDYDTVAQIYEQDILNRWQHLTDMRVLSAEELAQLEHDASSAQAAAERYAENLANGVEGYTKEGLESAQKTASDLMSVYDEAVENSKDSGSDASGNFADGVSDGESEAYDSGLSLIEAMKRGLLSGEGSAIATATSIGKNVGNALGDGSGATATSHAGGLDYVPYDNYAASLHRGEAVLTAREAEEWRRGERSGRQIVNNFTFNGVSQSDLDMIVAYVNRQVVMG